MENSRFTRVTVTLDPIDVGLLDRVAKLSGTNRSIELRGVLSQLRPVLSAVVEASDAVVRSRDALNEAAAAATRDELQAMLPELEKLQGAFLGSMARLEGAAAVAEQNPRASNTGVTPSPHLTEDGEK